MDAREATDDARLRLRVRGQVQGVFFRASTRERATELGLVGWVRNAEDGTVEIEAQGNRRALETLAAWAGRGPPAARVESVDVEDVEPLAPPQREAAFGVRG